MNFPGSHPEGARRCLRPAGREARRYDSDVRAGNRPDQPERPVRATGERRGDPRVPVRSRRPEHALEGIRSVRSPAGIGVRGESPWWVRLPRLPRTPRPATGGASSGDPSPRSGEGCCPRWRSRAALERLGRGVSRNAALTLLAEWQTRWVQVPVPRTGRPGSSPGEGTKAPPRERRRHPEAHVGSCVLSDGGSCRSHRAGVWCAAPRLRRASASEKVAAAEAFVRARHLPVWRNGRRASLRCWCPMRGVPVQVRGRVRAPATAPAATWPSGQALACKASQTGSTPVVASMRTDRCGSRMRERRMRCLS